VRATCTSCAGVSCWFGLPDGMNTFAAIVDGPPVGIVGLEPSLEGGVRPTNHTWSERVDMDMGEEMGCAGVQY
jgi:hypothetical protein